LLTGIYLNISDIIYSIFTLIDNSIIKVSEMVLKS